MKKNASGIIPGFSPNRGPIKIYNCPPKTHYCYNKIFIFHFIKKMKKNACVGRSGGVRSTIEEQLIAILSAGKYSSDFNAKKIVSVARSVPEISSVE